VENTLRIKEFVTDLLNKLGYIQGATFIRLSEGEAENYKYLLKYIKGKIYFLIKKLVGGLFGLLNKI